MHHVCILSLSLSLSLSLCELDISSLDPFLSHSHTHTHTLSLHTYLTLTPHPPRADTHMQQTTAQEWRGATWGNAAGLRAWGPFCCVWLSRTCRSPTLCCTTRRPRRSISPIVSQRWPSGCTTTAAPFRAPRSTRRRWTRGGRRGGCRCVQDACSLVVAHARGSTGVGFRGVSRVCVCRCHNGCAV